MCPGGVCPLCDLPVLCDTLSPLHMGPTQAWLTQEPLRCPTSTNSAYPHSGQQSLFTKAVGSDRSPRNQSDWIKHQNVPTALPAALFALHYLYHLKNNAKYHKSLKGGSFKIQFGETPTAKMGKPFTERASSQSTHPIPVHLTHSTHMTVPFWIQVLFMPQGLWSSPRCSSGRWGEGSAGGWVLGYLMLGNALNNLGK